MTRNCMRMFAWTLVSLSPLIVTSNPARAQSAEAKAEPVLVDLKFPGGTIKEYLAAVRQKVGDKVNIVVTDDRAGEPRLPAMELAEVDVESAVSLIQGVYTLDDGSLVRLKVESIERSGGIHGKPVFRIASTFEGLRVRPQVKVWSLSELIGERIKAEDALTAIELAVGITDAGARTADVRFHEATSLLVANGTPDQIDAIDSVVKQLRGREEQIRQQEAGIQNYEDFVGWIEEMRKFDEAQQALAAEQAAQQGSQTHPPHSDLRGSYRGGAKGEPDLLREIERLTRVIQDQAKRIESLEKRLRETEKR